MLTKKPEPMIAGELRLAYRISGSRILMTRYGIWWVLTPVPVKRGIFATLRLFPLVSIQRGCTGLRTVRNVDVGSDVVRNESSTCCVHNCTSLS